MKKIAIVGALILAGTSAALAKVTKPNTVTDADTGQAYNWAGLYIGGNIGSGWGKANNNFSDIIPGSGGPPIGAGVNATNVKGVFGGFQTGYQWQTGSFVFGLETDIQLSGQQGYGTAICPGATCVGGGGRGGTGDTVADTERLTWFGTTRGRLGWAFDNLLAYGTGGVAYGAVKTSSLITVPSIPVTTPFASGSTIRSGWAAGGGLEGAVTANWTARIEYLYIDFGTANFQSTPGAPFTGGIFQDSTRLHENIVRVGLSYRF